MGITAANENVVIIWAALDGIKGEGGGKEVAREHHNLNQTEITFESELEYD